MAQRYRTTPSQLVGLTDPYTAWCLDEAVYIFANHVESKLAEAANRQKGEKQKAAAKQRMLTSLLADAADKEGEAAQGKFRDPAAGFTKKK